MTSRRDSLLGRLKRRLTTTTAARDAAAADEPVTQPPAADHIPDMSAATIETAAAERSFSARTRTPFQGMSFDGSRLWRFGDDTGGSAGRRETAGDPPVAGDLWIVASELPGVEDFGATDVAVLLVHSVDEGTSTVLASPVTSLSEPASVSNAVLTDSLFGCPVVLWTGITQRVAFSTLTRRVGTSLDAFTLAKIRNGLAPLPTVGDLAGDGQIDAPTDETSADHFAEYLARLMDALAVPGDPA